MNSKEQAWAIWQFRERNANRRLDGFAVAALVQFEQKAALPIVVENMRFMAAGGQEFYIREFLQKLKPKFLIPELIRIYNTKESFLPDVESEKRFRRDVLQTLFAYRSPLAIPIYRENLVDKDYEYGKPNLYVAELLFELNAVEALDDLIIAFADLKKSSSPGSDNDLRAGQLAVVLAKFGDQKTWKQLIEFVDKTGYYDREQILIELNKHLDARLWNDTHNRKPSQFVAAVKPFVENLSRESGISITMPDILRSDTCPKEPTDDKEAIGCAWADPRGSIHNSLLTALYMLNRKRGQYFCLRQGIYQDHEGRGCG